MKKGIVLYLADAKTIPAEADLTTALVAAGLDPQTTELAGHGLGDIPRATLNLVARGMGKVDLLRGSLCENRGLALFAKPARIFG